MKFRFCGDADCPDWVLVEIYNLSRLSSIKLKLLVQLVAQGILNPPIDFQKVEQIFADSKLDSDIDLQACVACISNILTVATRFNTDSNILQSELQQLGLPREHSTSIKRVFDDQFLNLTDKFRTSSLKVNSLKKVVCISDTNTKCAIAEFLIDNKTSKVLLTPKTVDSLLNDLKNVRKTMVELTSSGQTI